MAKKLTKGDIDRATYQGGEACNEWDVRWDSLIPGFGVRIYTLRAEGVHSPLPGERGGAA
jgi:hypothetical protein